MAREYKPTEEVKEKEGYIRDYVTVYNQIEEMEESN